MMGNMRLHNEQSMLADPPTSFVESAQAFGLSIDAALDARTNFGDSWPAPLHEARWRGGPARGHRSEAVLAAVSGVVFLAKVLWASPWSMLGMAIGAAALLTGGGVRRNGHVLEFWGGILPAFLKCFPLAVGSAAFPFGHVILGRSERYLDACRPHQLVHVRQYEHWGPLFVPTYLMCLLVQWCRGKRPYYDNPFEREAYEQTIW
jgi:hypothetical protein